MVGKSAVYNRTQGEDSKNSDAMKKHWWGVDEMKMQEEAWV
jgi:hypothetical protein